MEFFKKHKKLSIIAGIVLVLIFIGMLGSDGGSDGGSDSGDDITQYLMYRKAGNVRDGYYIEVVGLNVECDETGALKVDLNEIWTKYQGKLVIPSEIEGLPVKKVKFNIDDQKLVIGGTVDTLNQVPVRFVTNGDDFVYYLDSFETYYKNIKVLIGPVGAAEVILYDLENMEELTLSAGTKKADLGARIKLKKFTLPVECEADAGWAKIDDVVYTVEDETKVPDKAVKIVRGRKSCVVPNCIKKIDLGKYLGIEDNFYAMNLTCAPDAEFFNPTKETIKKGNIKIGDETLVNGKSLAEYIK